MLREFNEYEDSSVKTLINLNLHLVKNIGQTISQLEYSHVNYIMYVLDCT